MSKRRRLRDIKAEVANTVEGFDSVVKRLLIPLPDQKDLDDEHEKIVDDLMRARQKNLKSRPMEKEKMGNRLEEIIRTAVMMGLHGLPSKFVEDAAHAAMDYDGIYDLMVMWREEVNSDECRKIVDTIQELLDEPILVMKRRMKRQMERGGQ